MKKQTSYIFINSKFLLLNSLPFSNQYYIEVQYSSVKDLKRQLREVAPMNASKSQIFCPNGQSSVVSPLMENKCNDQLAMPSVFGRSDDIMGNSIPGRSPGYNIGGSSSLSADTGGFPAYGGGK